MKGFYATQIKFLFFIVIVLGLVVTSPSFAQVSPYSLSNEWRFGNRAGLSFPNGDFPTSAAPTTTPIAQNTGNLDVETSTSISDTSGALALYTNTMRVYNNTHTSQRNLETDGTCAGSATAGGVIVPDPASPFDTYYLFLANDVTSGACNGNGINYYRFRKNGLGQVVYLSGNNLLIASNQVDESLCAGSDGQGNYWICSHATGDDEILVWKVTSTGVSAVDIQTTSVAVNGTSNGSIKMSPCQDKIAWAGNGNILVYEWNRTTGKIGSLVRQINGTDTQFINAFIGIEFSPDGSKLYYAGLGGNALWGPLKQAPLPAGAITQIDDANGSATMQLGPDGKIYTTNGLDGGTRTNVGVINAPNAAAASVNYNHTQISLPAGATLSRGISNIAWLNPNDPAIDTNIAGCKVDFNHLFKNYFNTNIGVNNASFSWNFGDGNTSTSVTPSHTYAADGTYNVTLSFRDATCNHTWTSNASITVDCSMPVSWLRFDGKYNGGKVDLEWATASEINNSHFIIQRSIDGINFSAIGRVEGSGTTSDFKFYKFTDHSPVYGKAYYRLLQVDFDGSADLSEMIEVNVNTSLIKVAPNPSEGNFNLSIIGTESASIYVTDVLGKVVFEASSENELSNVSFGENLPKGTYILNVVTSDNSYTDKLIKE